MRADSYPPSYVIGTEPYEAGFVSPRGEAAGPWCVASCGDFRTVGGSSPPGGKVLSGLAWLDRPWAQRTSDHVLDDVADLVPRETCLGTGYLHPGLTSRPGSSLEGPSQSAVHIRIRRHAHLQSGRRPSGVLPVVCEELGCGEVQCVADTQVTKPSPRGRQPRSGDCSLAQRRGRQRRGGGTRRGAGEGPSLTRSVIQGRSSATGTILGLRDCGQRDPEILTSGSSVQ